MQSEHVLFVDPDDTITAHDNRTATAPDASYIRFGNAVIHGDLPVLQRHAVELDAALQQLASARLRDPLVEIHELAVGDAISFDGERWHVLTVVEADPEGEFYVLAWDIEDGQIGITRPLKETVRCRRPAVHAMEAVA